MSLENHPNFHAVLFTSTIVQSFYDSLRGGANKDNAPDIHDDIIKFVTAVEAKVDAVVEAESEDPSKED
jgi:hypothetical protein